MKKKRPAKAQAKKELGVERDVFLSCAKMSGEVFDKYYNVPILRPAASAAERAKARERVVALQLTDSADVPEAD